MSSVLGWESRTVTVGVLFGIHSRIGVVIRNNWELQYCMSRLCFHPINVSRLLGLIQILGTMASVGSNEALAHQPVVPDSGCDQSNISIFQSPTHLHHTSHPLPLVEVPHTILPMPTRPQPSSLSLFLLLSTTAILERCPAWPSSRDCIYG